MLVREERKARLKRFHMACSEAGLQELAPYVFELGGNHPKTLTLSTLVHGNEIGGMEIFLCLLEEVRTKKIIPKSNLRFVLGNVNAYLEDKRFLETDLNRSFDLPEHRTIEELRAKELENFFEDTDVLVDFHQTIGRTSTPFFIFEYEEHSFALARHLHPTLPIILSSKHRPFKGKTTTGHVISKKGMAITIETGQKGIEDIQSALGLKIARRAVETDFSRPLPPSPFINTHTFHQIISNPQGNLELVKVFENFDPVTRDEVLATGPNEVIRAKQNGIILFPKYGDYAKASKELALILRPVNTKKDLPDES